MEKPSVVVTDLHGEANRFKQVVRHYGDDVHFVVNGDIYDRGKDVKGLMDILSDTDCSINLGNHDWGLVAALSETDPNRRDSWQMLYLGSIGSKMRYEKNVLISYGVREMRRRDDTCKALRERLESLGHWALIMQAKTYYEDDAVLAVHAGLDTSKPMQYAFEKLAAAQEQFDSQTFLEEPDELRADAFALDTTSPNDLHKPLVTGHMHYRKPIHQRQYFDGNSLKRVHLASVLNKDDPLYVFESNTQQIRAFTAS